MSQKLIKSSANPFRLPFRNRFFAQLLERILGLSKLIKFYDRREPDMSTVSFLRYTLDCFDVSLKTVDEHQTLESLPKQGPLLITANHPLGGLEGVALAQKLLEFRPDTRVLTNELLTRIPELASIFIGVDVLSNDSKAENFRGIREATRHLANGGALLLFPAGKVASFNLKKRKIQDYDWNRLVGHLVRKTQPTVLPVYVDGLNSKLFYFMALIHPILRSLMLPRELSNKQNFNLGLVFGQTVNHQDLRHLNSPQAITDYLRLTTELLRPNVKGTKVYKGVKQAPLSDLAHQGAYENPDNLPDITSYRLIETNDFDVFCAPFEVMGKYMELLGAARELTFRAAGEGTGNNIDIDQFDSYYLHLFLWDKKAGRVAGGYRIGRVDEIVGAKGIEGLYSRTLYAFNEGYLKKMGNPLEIGRSFVHPDYQRETAGLDLLWRGVGIYVSQHPEYNTLFGAVSISNEHSDLARALIAESMLESFRAEQRFLEDVKPVQPLKISGKVWTQSMLASLTHISLVNKLIGRCDPGKTLPMLLRHYLALNGRFVCFSINKVFNDSLDGLIIVDLRLTPKKYLNRYMGKEGAQAYTRIWDSDQARQKTA